MFFIGKIKEIHAARYQPETQEKIARGYWAFLLSCVALAVTGGLGVGIWEFSRPHAAEGGATLGAPQSPLDTGKLRAVLDGFDARVRRFEERQNAPAFADPS